jgi:hypothetical protein
MKLKRGLIGILAVLMLLTGMLAGGTPVLADGGGGESSPYAVEVVSSTGPFGSSPYDDPNAVLGKPTTIYKDPWTSPPTELLKLVEPAWNVGLDDESLITTLNEGAEIVVRFDHQVENDPNNPYGIDLIVFGNAFFAGSGWVSDETDMDTYMLNDPAGCNTEPVTVAVSQDGENWHEFTDGPYADSMFPTHAWEWDSVNHEWTDNEMDFTRPVDPSLTLSDFNGISAAQAIALYDGSGGGTGYDLAETPYSWIQYVKVTSAGGEIDAFADVAPAAAPPITVDLRASGIAGDIIDVDGYSVPAGTVSEDGFDIDAQTAMGALVYYCQQEGVTVELTDSGWGTYVIQIGDDPNDENCWMYAVNEVSPGVGADQYPLASDDSVHWYNYNLGLYSLSLSLDKTEITPGEDITATVTYTDGNGTTSPVEGADVYVSDVQYEPGNPVGETTTGGELAFNWSTEGQFWPYAEYDGLSSMYQYPAPTFTCSSGTYPDWDVNEDGSINIADVGLVGMHWGESGDPGWIREDVNDDGEINIADVGIIGMHWGE